MTAGNHGSGTPENDDPFGYLYRSEGGTGGAAGAATQQPGVPRTSYNHVRAVGERRYGGQQAAPAQNPSQSQEPNAHYAAPETVPGGRAAARQNGHGAGRGAAKNRNGLLIGAIAVAAAVVLGVGSAIVFSDDSETGTDGDLAANPASPPAGSDDEGDSGDDAGSPDEDKEKPKAKLPEEDAASLRLLGGPALAGDIPGAQAKGGTYVTGFNQPGASATWTFDVPESGKYTLFVGYGVPGKDADSTLTVNAKTVDRPLNMKNFAQAGEGQWDKGWTRTYAYLDLNKGTNSVKLSCEQGNQCDFVLDRLWLEGGHTTG